LPAPPGLLEPLDFDREPYLLLALLPQLPLALEYN
jgi:hypothetical protein